MLWSLDFVTSFDGREFTSNLKLLFRWRLAPDSEETLVGERDARRWSLERFAMPELPPDFGFQFRSLLDVLPEEDRKEEISKINPYC